MNRYIEMLINTPPRFYLHTAKYKLAEKTVAENYNAIKPCAFTLSTGRVGTETLATLYGLDKNLIAMHEPLPKLFGASKTCYDLGEHAKTDGKVEFALVEAFLTGRRDLLNYALYTGHGFVETGPDATFVAPFILKAIPDVRFIHMVRDPRAVVVSGLRRKWYAGQINDQWRITPRLGDPFEPLWEKMDQVERLLWLWAETNRWILDFSSTLKGNRCLLVNSEDLFAAKSDTIRSLYDHLALAVPADRKIRRVLNKRINSQKSGDLEKPVDWNRQFHPVLMQFVSTVAASLGYQFP